MIVIGAGLAGLVAAAAAASRGKSVLVLTKGAAAISIGGGAIDVLGYDAEGRSVASPLAGIETLPEDHPYRRIGVQRVTEALEFFQKIAVEAGYPYSGNIGHTQWLPTAVGTLKPSCLVPGSMSPLLLAAAEEVVVVGFSRLKDYYPELIIQGLRQNLSASKRYQGVTLDAGLADGRDITALDVARWLDCESGRQQCIAQIRQQIPAGSIVLIPPVLGTKPDCLAVKQLEQQTGCHFIETTGLPPAVTGLRLRTMLVSQLKKNQVKIIEQANVTGALVESGYCRAVTTSNVDRERHYYGKAFVLATGGFFGGGLQSEAGWAGESIYKLPMSVPSALRSA